MIQVVAVLDHPGNAVMLKLPRTIRLDPSDTFVFERAAEPGEWAVSGTFALWSYGDPATFNQKQRTALRAGLLGIESLGWSTLAIVTEATDGDHSHAVGRLAEQLLNRFGAPDLATAQHSAEEEIAFAASLCDHPLQTLLAVQRSVEGGEIRERFRTLTPRSSVAGADRLHAHARAFTFLETEGEMEAEEQVDLTKLTKTDRT